MFTVFLLGSTFMDDSYTECGAESKNGCCELKKVDVFCQPFFFTSNLGSGLNDQGNGVGLSWG